MTFELQLRWRLRAWHLSRKLLSVLFCRLCLRFGQGKGVLPPWTARFFCCCLQGALQPVQFSGDQSQPKQVGCCWLCRFSEAPAASSLIATMSFALATSRQRAARHSALRRLGARRQAPERERASGVGDRGGDRYLVRVECFVAFFFYYRV